MLMLFRKCKFSDSGADCPCGVKFASTKTGLAITVTFRATRITHPVFCAVLLTLIWFAGSVERLLYRLPVFAMPLLFCSGNSVCEGGASGLVRPVIFFDYLFDF